MWIADENCKECVKLTPNTMAPARPWVDWSFAVRMEAFFRTDVFFVDAVATRSFTIARLPAKHSVAAGSGLVNWRRLFRLWIIRRQVGHDVSGENGDGHYHQNPEKHDCHEAEDYPFH